MDEFLARLIENLPIAAAILVIGYMMFREQARLQYAREENYAMLEQTNATTQQQLIKILGETSKTLGLMQETLNVMKAEFSKRTDHVDRYHQEMAAQLTQHDNSVDDKINASEARVVSAVVERLEALEESLADAIKSVDKDGKSRDAELSTKLSSMMKKLDEMRETLNPPPAEG